MTLARSPSSARSGLTHNGYVTTATTSTTAVSTQTYTAGSSACTGTGPALSIKSANTLCNAAGAATEIPACVGHTTSTTETGYSSFKSYQSGGTSSVEGRRQDPQIHHQRHGVHVDDMHRLDMRRDACMPEVGDLRYGGRVRAHGQHHRSDYVAVPACCHHGHRLPRKDHGHPRPEARPAPPHQASPSTSYRVRGRPRPTRRSRSRPPPSTRRKAPSTSPDAFSGLRLTRRVPVTGRVVTRTGLRPRPRRV